MSANGHPAMPRRVKRPMLHTRVRFNLDLPHPPEDIADKLRDLHSETIRVHLPQTIGDDIPFRVTRRRARRDDIVIGGVLRRWQGTETRLTITGEVDVPPPDMNIQRLLVALITFFPAYGMVRVLQWMFNAADPFSSPLFICLGGIFMLLGVLTVAAISYWNLVRDTASRERWHVQQEMVDLLHDVLTQMNAAGDTLATQRLMNHTTQQSYPQHPAHRIQTTRPRA